jgi:FkbM family methyltransferase
MIASISMHLRRRLNARRFGVPFARRASFVVPKRIRLGAQFVPLALPPEHGAQSDFVTCFINDDYGLSKTKGPVKTIADIGANIGFFSMAARSYFPNATIHAYEPNPRILQYSTTNAACAEFTLFSEAVGRTTGLVSIVDCGDSNQARTSSAENRVASVPQVVFSTVVRRLGGQIDLVKIDCVGAICRRNPVAGGQAVTNGVPSERGPNLHRLGMQPIATWIPDSSPPAIWTIRNIKVIA